MSKKRRTFGSCSVCGRTLGATAIYMRDGLGKVAALCAATETELAAPIARRVEERLCLTRFRAAWPDPQAEVGYREYLEGKK